MAQPLPGGMVNFSEIDAGRSVSSTPEATAVRPRRFADTSASVLLDLLRGVAAFLVLLEHWRNAFFVDYRDVAGSHALWLIFYAFSGAGHQAVIVFFVLSGFFIGGTVLRAMEKDQWRWSAYLLRRLVRLWIVLLPALLMCLFWDKLGIRLGSAYGLYHGRAVNHILLNVSELLSPHIFFANLFFLQGILAPCFGSDGALWSLANEFWYYLLFPLGLVALYPSIRPARRIASAVLFCLAAWFVRMPILIGFPIWLCGVLLVRLPPPRFTPQAARRARIIAPLLYTPVFLYLAKSRSIGGAESDYILTGFTCFLLWILLSASEPHPLHSHYVRSSRGLARFSYTLYAVHTPMVVFLASVLVHDSRWQPTPAHFAAAAVVLIAVVAYSLGLAWLAEFRTDTVHDWLAQLLRVKPRTRLLPSNPSAEES